eukprot:6331952-Lingulodinium_polyedra.AAC.1
MLTDLAFPENGVRAYKTRTQEWTLVVQGKVGIALDQTWAKRWRETGAVVRMAGRAEDRANRVVAVGVGRQG